jgi:hypothetical protein
MFSEKEKKRKKEKKNSYNTSGAWHCVKPERSEFISGLMQCQAPDKLGEFFL